MEKNNAEDTKSSEDENESFSLLLSENFSITSTINEAVIHEEKEKKNEQTIDIDKASTSKEAASTSIENEIVDSQQQQNICKTDCNGDPKEESNLEEDASITDEASIEESNLKKSCSMVTKSTSERVKQKNLFDANTTRLIEILKIVHEDSGNNKKTNSDTLIAMTDDSKDNSKKEQQPITKEETSIEGDAVNSMNESSTSTFEKIQEEKRYLKESLEKTKDNSEVGIVGPPTAATLLINQEELQGDSVISTDQEDHVAEWIEESVKQIAEKEKKFAKAKCKRKIFDQNTEHVKPKQSKLNNSILMSPRSKASQKVIKSIIKRSIKYLNKMHAMEGAVENKKKVNTAEDEKPSNMSSSSSKVPQSQQNGAALPEETATAPTTAMSRVRIKKDTLKKKDSQCNVETPETTKDEQLLASTSRQKIGVTDQRQIKFQSVESLKRRKSTNGQVFAENPRKKLRIDDQREEYILRMVGNDNESVDELMARANQLRSDILALENLQRAKEMEWNDILRKRKLKEEAYTRLERKIRMTVEVENDDQSLPLESSPPHKSSLVLSEWENIGKTTSIVSKERSLESKDDLIGERSLDSPIQKKEKTAKVITQQRTTPPKTNGESNRKPNEAMSPESRQIGEGRQGAIVDVRSIIADHRLKHPETVPRRGRRMRSSVNIGLGAGGAMVETGHNTDSRPSSTESCKSTPSATDSMNYKDMLVQFAKMSQQGESVKVPQNYPDVTLHPVAPSSAPQNTSSQSSSSSLLHGILTKTQSPRSTTFSPTLARLLTAPERERNSPAAAAAAVASTSQQSATTQHLLQTYQGSNLVSINDLLSSSKARTEITITPVVNTSTHSHSNDLIPVEDVEEEATSNDDRRGSSASSKQVVKDSPSSPNAAPKCQGCIIRPAQFVCAGCGNQWYCSRTCQLAAWSTHSDYCPPESENGKAKTIV